jgi:hypothetical protein
MYLHSTGGYTCKDRTGMYCFIMGLHIGHTVLILGDDRQGIYTQILSSMIYYGNVSFIMGLV